MTLHAPRVICEGCISAAWARALVAVMDLPSSRVVPMMLSVIGGEQALPDASDRLRRELDGFLINKCLPTTGQSALTIFPYSMWVRRGRPGVTEFSELCTSRLYPRMKSRNNLNRYGTYFQRMMAYPSSHDGTYTCVNQLEHIIRLMTRERRSRESALQISILHPALDHTGQAVRGFPCLQQIGLSYGDDDTLALNAFYPTQYIVDRGYGNYLGLCHLGLFIAAQTGLRFHRLNCYIASPVLGKATKTELGRLTTLANAIITPTKGMEAICTIP